MGDKMQTDQDNSEKLTLLLRQIIPSPPRAESITQPTECGESGCKTTQPHRYAAQAQVNDTLPKQENQTMKHNRDRCLTLITQWFTGAPAGTGISLKNFRKHYGADRTEEDLECITSYQVGVIFNTCWRYSKADELPVGVDLFMVSLAVYVSCRFALTTLESVVGSVGKSMVDAANLTLTHDLLRALIGEGELKPSPVVSAMILESTQMVDEQVYSTEQVQKDDSVQKEQEEFINAWRRYNRLLGIAQSPDGDLSRQEGEELHKMADILDRSRWEMRRGRVMLKEPHQYPDMEAHPASTDKRKRCCGNCCWRDEDIGELNGIVLVEGSYDVVCAYNPELVLRPKSSRCHHHALVTGWGEEAYLKERAFSDELYRIASGEVRIDEAANKVELPQEEEKTNADHPTQNTTELIANDHRLLRQLASDAAGLFTEFMHGRRELTATFATVWLERYHETIQAKIQ